MQHYPLIYNLHLFSLFQTLLGLSQHTDIYLLNDMDSDTLVER